VVGGLTRNTIIFLVNYCSVEYLIFVTIKHIRAHLLSISILLITVSISFHSSSANDFNSNQCGT
jgi:hypothetical protein